MKRICLCQSRRAVVIGFAVLALMYVTFVIYSGNVFTNPLKCYRVKGDSLPDISDTEPPKGKSIFFHETTCNSFINDKIVISPRQACAVESAALMNPNFNVYLLFTSPGIIKFESSESDNILKALLSYKNLQILHVDYERYTKDTVFENLYRERRVESSSYPVSHASDIFRYLTLWKYGGIYLDLDLIVIKSLENLPPNYAGVESNFAVAAGILSFAPTGTGHHLASLCVEDLSNNFNGRGWGDNGPELITRILQKVCNVKEPKDMIKAKCDGFTVYPPETFYLIPWRNWTMYFDSKYNEEVVKKSVNSYILHVWNLHSASRKINVSVDVPYTIFAKQYCPKVFSQCKTYF